MNRKADPVTIEVVRNLLMSIAEETNTVIIKSAYSTNIKERRDNTTAIMDPAGNVVVQVESSIPMLLAALLFAARGVVAEYKPEDIHPGDMFIVNDPYHGGGNHLPDITVVGPVFVGQKLIGWVGNTAHHSDIGGKVPGSTSGDADSLFQEGIRIPIVKICKEGKFNDDVLKLLLGNTRTPDERRGDLTAQVSANIIGAQKLQAAYEKYQDTLLDCMAEMLDYTDRLMRDAISKIPDGEYKYVDYVDGCGTLYPDPININVRVTVSGEKMTIDFTGTHPQVNAPINIPYPAMLASVLFCMKALIDPDLPTNWGILRPIEIVAPKGIIVNPNEPCAVGLTIDANQRVPDAIFGALNPVLPKRALAASNGACTTCVFFGQTTSNGADQYFICHESIAGGAGASHYNDGLSGVQVYLTNTSNMPIEATEGEFSAIRLKKYVLRKDSGGAGEFRGGLGIWREYTVLNDNVAVNCFGDRQRFAPWGMEGGLDGEPGAFYHISAETGAVTKLSAKTTGFPLKKGDIIRIKDTSQANFDMTLMMTLTADKAGTANCGKDIVAIRTNAVYGTITTNGNVVTWDTSGIGYYFWDNFAWLRVTTHSADAIVTVNEEITDTVTTQNVLKPSVKVKKANVDFDIASPLLSGKTVVCFGDSIFGMTRDTTSVPAWAAAFTGAKVYNVGFGGCRMAVHPTSGYAAFSMWALADAVATGTYTTQDAQASSGADYFAQQLAVLKGIDFGSVDTVVIHYGTNDFTGNVAIDNATDDDDTSTLCGALRYALRKIQTAYPKIRVFISSPIYRKWDSTGAETYTNANGKKLREFCTALAGVADEFNCPCIDGYKALGINTANASAFLADGTHLNERGRQAFGEYIGGCLISPKA